MSILKVDQREGKCKEFFDEQKIECTLEVLEHGDFQICNAEGIVQFLFERKTVEDLLASIKDGRYKNQKARCLGIYKNTQIYYIIEGTVSYKPSSIASQKVVQGAVINTLLRDKIGVFITKSVEETCQLLISIFTRYKTEPEKYGIYAANVEQVEVVQSSSDASPQKVFKSMLCQIPYINEKSAIELISRFGSFKAMLAELGDKSEEERLETLNAIKVNGRKMSKRIAESICRNLF